MPLALIWINSEKMSFFGSITSLVRITIGSSSKGPDGLAVNAEGYCMALCSQEHNFGPVVGVKSKEAIEMK